MTKKQSIMFAIGKKLQPDLTAGKMTPGQVADLLPDMYAQEVAILFFKYVVDNPAAGTIRDAYKLFDIKILSQEV
jgi:hypothetical protein